MTATRAKRSPRPHVLRLRPADRWAQHPMAERLASWCQTPDGRTDPRLHYRTGGPSPQGEWTLEPDMLAQYGPLPFTSRSRPIRWRWWHSLLGSAAFTVYHGDVPESGVRNE